MVSDRDVHSAICAERVYRNDVETCERLGVEPAPRERAPELKAEWSDAIAAGRAVPPITH